MKTIKINNKVSLPLFTRKSSTLTYLIMLILASAVLFTTSSCEKEDDIIECPEGFTGDGCEDEITPSRMTITAVRVTKYPLKRDNGDFWDPAAGTERPDLLVKVRYYEGTNSDILVDTEHESQTDPSLSVVPLEIITNNDIVFPTHRHRVSLYDFDPTNADDFMGGKNFYPYLDIEGQGFPSTITVGNDKFEVEMDVEYTWN